MCLCFYECFKTGHVQLRNYPNKCHSAIWSQGGIGWRQIFNGKNITTLARTPRRHNNYKGKSLMEYVWGASIVEICLQMMMELWGMRNEEIHSKKRSSKKSK